MPAPKRRVRWSPAALKDTREITDYLSKTVPLPAAVRIVRTIEATIERVAKRPLQARSRGELRAGLRGALAGAYIVFYRPKSMESRSRAFLHQRRDLASAFDESEPEH